MSDEYTRPPPLLTKPRPNVIIRYCVEPGQCVRAQLVRPHGVRALRAAGAVLAGAAHRDQPRRRRSRRHAGRRVRLRPDVAEVEVVAAAPQPLLLLGHEPPREGRHGGASGALGSSEVRGGLGSSSSAAAATEFCSVCPNDADGPAEACAARRSYSGFQTPETNVNCLYGLDRGIQNTSVSYHVSICKIGYY